MATRDEAVKAWIGMVWAVTISFGVARQESTGEELTGMTGLRVADKAWKRAVWR